ncbi:hypothetical protein [Paraburkholderia hospita]|uniref:hypothetical protein n=1 Tax=Paraburkholderia hospita TaxID=169430 RepID=UPI0002716193|nr:hypothetical protein [Paraburkholderia hospita]EUC15018.1 hypothetical protein PMI06_006194 [Burkholderia sp. BT03]SKC94368.1 hypothetical protein SAMN06266956_6246 [Paraburkholderia hospita]
MHPLKQRARENELTLLHYLASFDCLTKKNIALLLYGKTDNSSVSYADRLTKRLMRSGWIARRRAADNLYRYFLSERGTYIAAETLPFTPRSGYDRSYLNAPLYERIDTVVIEDMWRYNGIGLGRGALRYLLNGKLTLLDGALTVEKSGTPTFIRFYVRINSLSQNAREHYDKCRKLAQVYKIPLKIVASDFIEKTLQKKR